jgi:hypothetical protein
MNNGGIAAQEQPSMLGEPMSLSEHLIEGIKVTGTALVHHKKLPLTAAHVKDGSSNLDSIQEDDDDDDDSPRVVAR